MSSLYDIIDLANETGDRIIVHDRYGEGDIALLPLREYRRLVRTTAETYTSVGDLSGDELIDKINRELSAWKAQQELDISDSKATILEEEFASNPPEDPFAEDFSHDPVWHKVGDILREQDAGMPEKEDAVKEEKIITDQPAAPVYSPIPLAPDMAETPLKFDDDDEPVFYEEPV